MTNKELKKLGLMEFRDLFPNKHYRFITKDDINYISTDGVDMMLEQAKKEVFDDIEKECNLWDTDNIRGSSETKSGDKWLSMDIVKKIKEKTFKKE